MRHSVRRHLAIFTIAGLLLGGLAVSAASAATPMMALGYQHALALSSDGTVRAWGSDNGGQLGSGRLAFETRPGLVAGLSNVRSIASGVNHSLAVRSDGSVWTWGANYAGQLGNGTNTDRSEPAQVPGLAGIAQVCGGGGYSLALAEDGSVWAWGDGQYGNLGNGTRESSWAPIRIRDLNSVASLACGQTHTLALLQDGSVLAWGFNGEGALGDGTTTWRLQPVSVSGLSKVIAVTAGGDFSVALKQDGTVWEWGVVAPNADPRGAPRLRPAQTAGLANVAAIVGGFNNFSLLAIEANRTSWWQWETGTTPILQEPVGTLQSAAAAYGQTLLLKADGTVLAGGGGGFGSLGDGTTNYRDSMGPVADIVNIVQVATGNWHGLALDAAGMVWSWGLDTSGQLGRGRILSRSVPGMVAGLNSITHVAAGTYHSLAVDQDGGVWVWGDNGYGQLGDGSYLSKSTPIRLNSISDVQAVAAGAYHSLALKRDGTVWQLSAIAPGQLEYPVLPLQVFNGAIALAAGPVHSLALRADGSVWAWGLNDKGQLGDGTRIDRAQPQPVPGVTNVKLIAASQTSSYAVKTDGTVMSWGENERGQLGDGTTLERGTPVAVVGLNGVVEISAGSGHVLARKSDGSVWGWRWDYYANGVFGDTPFAGLGIASAISGIKGIRQISAGYEVTGLVREDGLVLMGGMNSIGQLGDGTFARRTTLGLVVNETATGFLDLMPGTPKNIQASLIPLFLVKAAKLGSNSALTLTTDVYGLLGTPIFSATPARGNRLAATSTYNIYVAALAGSGLGLSWYQLDANRSWGTLNWPMAQFLSGITLSSNVDSITLQILDGVDVSSLIGSHIYVGYGTSADEMLTAGRYREVLTIQ